MKRQPRLEHRNLETWDSRHVIRGERFEGSVQAQEKGLVWEGCRWMMRTATGSGTFWKWLLALVAALHLLLLPGVTNLLAHSCQSNVQSHVSPYWLALFVRQPDRSKTDRKE